jgi:Double zinc ribbon
VNALFIGAALAVGALVYVLIPLFEAVVPGRRRLTGKAAIVALVPETAIDALREIEFDRATGKLSDDDYSSLKAEYTRTALVELRSRPGPAAPVVSTPPAVAPPNEHGSVRPADDIEAAVLRYRSVRRACATCGPRPEPDPAFCSSCGTYLKGSCTHCGTPVDAVASRFCANCGGSLAA